MFLTNCPVLRLSPEVGKLQTNMVAVRVTAMAMATTGNLMACLGAATTHYILPQHHTQLTMIAPPRVGWVGGREGARWSSFMTHVGDV